MDMVKYWQGFAMGYADAAGRQMPKPGTGPGLTSWGIGYMAGYVSALGIKVGTPNA